MQAQGQLRSRILATLFCGAILALLPAAAAAQGGAQASIVGGRAATIAEFPSLAYIQAGERKNGFACTGAVVAPRVILTAAHCVEDIETGRFTRPAEYAVATGIANPRQATRENVFGVVAAHVFPTFDPGAVHGDAALLILSRPTSAPPLALAGPADAALYEGGAAVSVAGWGLTRGQNRKAPDNLRAATMTVQKPSTCRRRSKGFYPEYSPAQQLCLLSPPANRSGACFGDSGGPAISLRADGTPVELGVISVVGPFCTPKAPNVLTRVDYVSAWVSGWIAAVETGAPPPPVDPRAPLPQMTKLTAENFAISTLFDVFGARFASFSSLAGGCRRVSRTRFRCEIVWLARRDVYAAIVSPFYVRRQQTNAWDSHYLVRWAAVKCLRSQRRCAIHTRRG
jgi:secreted trypsin-like serine protease